MTEVAAASIEGLAFAMRSSREAFLEAARTV
jgi:hypothetical protein